MKKYKGNMKILVLNGSPKDKSDIEKRIFGLMVERLGQSGQLIFTTHNTDMLNLNLPNHTFAFIRKSIEDGIWHVSVTFASDHLRRRTDSVKCAMENDVFDSLPDESLLDDLETAPEVDAI